MWGLLLCSLSVSPTFSRFSSSVVALQESLRALAAASDPTARWTDERHAQGRAIIVENGEIWEKGCVSTTVLQAGKLSAARAEAISARVDMNINEGEVYSACALSFVLHAASPLVPTLRGDVRLFVVGEREWFGGGIDLTPSYVEDEDCVAFHSYLAALCARHGGPGVYERMKATCDDYFFLPAREEHRGVGGVFFDDMTEEWAEGFAEELMRCALAEDGPYMPIVRKRLPREYTDEQKQWQLLRRGRYVEFNLLYDRGVKFGLSPQSVERVLVSSPPLVAFQYKAIPPEGSAEAYTLDVLRNPREWAAERAPTGAAQ